MKPNNQVFKENGHLQNLSAIQSESKQISNSFQAKLENEIKRLEAHPEKSRTKININQQLNSRVSILVELASNHQ